MTDDHGWTNLEGVTSVRMDGVLVNPASVATAPIVDEAHRCVCANPDAIWPCQRAATQEDFLCDECRTTQSCRRSR